MNYNYKVRNLSAEQIMNQFLSFYTAISIIKQINPGAVAKYATLSNPKFLVGAYFEAIFGSTKSGETIKWPKLVLIKNSIMVPRENKINKFGKTDNVTHYENILILQNRFNIHSDVYTCAKKALLSWPSLDSVEKAEALNAAFALLQQSNMDYALQSTCAALNNELFLSASSDGSKTLIGAGKRLFRRMTEEADGVGDMGKSEGGTTSGAIAPFTVVDGKIIRRKVKKFVAYHFKNPNNKSKRVNRDKETNTLQVTNYDD